MQETMTVLLTTQHGSAPVPVEIPRRIKNVKLGGLLGEGAGGAVFSGYDETLNRTVAVKLLHRQGEFGDEAATLEVVEGLRSAARIKHPNIVQVYTVETLDKLPVVILEYVDGPSLRELQQRTGAMEAPLALFVIRSIVAGVQALHEHDVLHRDLKPANILFDRKGHVFVCDFGLACQFSRSALRGDTKTVSGTPLYMAPEMFEGHVSPQSDVYALGVILFELLCGAPPFSASSMSELHACHVAQPVPLERLHQRNLPDELCDLLGRALHKQRFLRYKTATHLSRALADLPGAEVRDDVQRARIESLINAQPVSRDGAEPRTNETPSSTMFDLIARRAAAKRESKQ